jgi:hypothetical protein
MKASTDSGCMSALSARILGSRYIIAQVVLRGAAGGALHLPLRWEELQQFLPPLLCC